jgi:hypothetical protein
MSLKGMHVKLQFCMPQDPERHHPCSTMYYNIEKNLRNYGKYKKKERNKPRLTINCRQCSYGLNTFRRKFAHFHSCSCYWYWLSKSFVHRIAKENRYLPYKMTIVQHLRITDSQHHLNFIAWLVVTYESNPKILQTIL